MMTLFGLNPLIQCRQTIKAHLFKLVVLPLLLVWSSQAFSQVITVAVGWNRPPYIISKTQSGFEIDLMRNIMERLGHEIKILSFSHADNLALLAAGKADIALTVNANSGIAPNHISDVYVVYQNVAVTLKSNKLTLRHVSDLQDLSMVGFQSASSALGKKFHEVTRNSLLYSELADQKSQIELLLSGQVDVIVIDLNVFNYLSLELNPHYLTPMDKVDIHPLFSLNRFSAGFKNITLKERFNQELGRYVASGEYDKLLSQYGHHIVIPK